MSGFLSGLLSSGSGASGWAAGNLRDAAIGGVPFFVNTAEDTPARRWITHEFPGRDTPWHEDLGGKAREYRIEGFLLGDDIVQQANDLADIAEAGDVASLVHPFYGEMDVVVLDCAIRHDLGAARTAAITLRVQIAGTRPAPDLSEDLLGSVIGAVNRVRSTVQRTLGRFWSLVGRVDYVFSAARGLIGQFVGTALGFLGTAGLGGTSGDVSDAAAQLTGIDDASLSSAEVVGARVGALLAAISTLAVGDTTTALKPTPQQSFDTLLDIAKSPGLPEPGATGTLTRQVLADNTTGLTLAVRTQAVAEAARAAMSIPFGGRVEALAVRQALADQIDDIADAAGVAGLDETWAALSDLRAAVVAELATRAARLPELRRITLAATLPASLLAYRLDGDALGDVWGRGLDLVARNDVRHPGFVPAGVPIEVPR